MYENLYKVIDDAIGYHSLDLHGVSPHGDDYFDGNLAFLVVEALAEDAPAVQAAAARRSPLKLRMTLPDAAEIETIGKKLVLYSDTSVVELTENVDIHPTYWSDDDGYDYMTADQQAKHDAEAKRQLQEWNQRVGPPNALDDLAPIQFIRGLVALRPFVESGRLIVIPKHRFTTSGDMAGPFLLDLEAYDVELQAQLMERKNVHSGDQSLEIKLPHLRHIPGIELAAFREHHAVEFERFHRHLAHHLAELSRGATDVDERRMVAAIDDIDYEIRRMDALYREARRKSLTLSAYDMAYFVGGLIAYGTLPEGLAQALLAIIGATRLKNVTDRLLTPAIDKSDPFYAPWKLHRKFGHKSRSKTS